MLDDNKRGTRVRRQVVKKALQRIQATSGGAYGNNKGSSWGGPRDANCSVLFISVQHGQSFVLCQPLKNQPSKMLAIHYSEG